MGKVLAVILVAASACVRATPAPEAPAREAPVEPVPAKKRIAVDRQETSLSARDARAASRRDTLIAFRQRAYAAEKRQDLLELEAEIDGYIQKTEPRSRHEIEPMFLVARYLLEHGAYDEGIELLDRLVTLWPDWVGVALLAQAEAALEQGHRARAEDLLAAALDIPRGLAAYTTIVYTGARVDASRLLGTIREEDGRFEQARAAYYNLVQEPAPAMGFCGNYIAALQHERELSLARVALRLGEARHAMKLTRPHLGPGLLYRTDPEGAVTYVEAAVRAQAFHEAELVIGPDTTARSRIALAVGQGFIERSPGQIINGLSSLREAAAADDPFYPEDADPLQRDDPMRKAPEIELAARFLMELDGAAEALAEAVAAGQPHALDIVGTIDLPELCRALRGARAHPISDAQRSRIDDALALREALP